MRRYACIATAASAGLGAMYYFITMSLLPIHLDVMMPLQGPYMIASIGLTGIVSVLGGINIAMITYRIRRMRMMRSVGTNSSAVFGGVFSAFTPGCPACTAPLAVVLGAVGGLSIFPMHGLELKLVSVGVLIFSIYWIARGLKKNSCCHIE